jgi:uncharacterized membrane protein YozB (DUF420 family)
MNVLAALILREIEVLTVQGAQSEAPSQSLFYPIVIVALILGAILSLSIFIARRKHVTLTSNQRNCVGLLLVLALVVTVCAISATPISQNQVPLSFRDINVVMQSLWMSLLLVSMWFRMRGNYFMHGILAIAVVSITIMSFLGVLIMSPMNSGSMSEYFSSPLDVAVLFAHGVVSFPALVFGVWLGVLWRPNSAAFAAKSHRIAQLTTIFWVLSYIVGILDYLLLRTNFG